MGHREEPIAAAPCAVDDDVERAVLEAERISHPPTLRTSTVDTMAGMAAGAVVGVLAGPPGVLAGMVLGAVAGAAAGLTVEGEEHERIEHDAELDTDIGVFGGRIGEPGPHRPTPPTDDLASAWVGAAAVGADPEQWFEGGDANAGESPAKRGAA